MFRSQTKAITITLAIGAAMLVWNVPLATATPIGALTYLETDIGGGAFRYDYTLLNQSDPMADTGFDIYDLILFLPSSVSLVKSELPTEWDSISGPGFVEAFSVSPGVTPFGADVAPDSALTGLSLTFNARIGPTPFQVLFSNPVDPANPVIYDGTATGADTSQVPEPTSLMLVASGVTTMLIRRRLRT